MVCTYKLCFFKTKINLIIFYYVQNACIILTVERYDSYNINMISYNRTAVVYFVSKCNCM